MALILPAGHIDRGLDPCGQPARDALPRGGERFVLVYGGEVVYPVVFSLDGIRMRHFGFGYFALAQRSVHIPCSIVGVRPCRRFLFPLGSPAALRRVRCTAPTLEARLGAIPEPDRGIKQTHPPTPTSSRSLRAQ